MLIRWTQNIQASYQAMQTTHFAKVAGNLTDISSFAFGLKGVYDMAKSYCFVERDISEAYTNLPLWQQQAYKIADFMNYFSVILRGVKTTPVVIGLKGGAQLLFSAKQLDSLFGRQGLFPSTKICSSLETLAFLLAIPTILKHSYSFYQWASAPPIEKEEENEEEHKNLKPPYTPWRSDEVYTTILTVSDTVKKMLENTPRK